MRLWSLHPYYLDAKGLVACWREGLLAKAVLTGQTRGYTTHPQLERFRKCPDPVQAINSYLSAICDEADRRSYSFDRTKLGPANGRHRIDVTSGQLAYELEHLRTKLAVRDPARASLIGQANKVRPHPLFRIVPGKVEGWEKIGRL